MSTRLPRLRLLVLATTLAFLSGCTMVHGWAQAGSDHPPRAGASVSVPLGR